MYSPLLPFIELIRSGSVLGTSKAKDPILAAPHYNDFYYSTGGLTDP
jgi:hypothetical protein